MSTPNMSTCIIYRERVTSRRLEPGLLEAVGEGATRKAQDRLRVLAMSSGLSLSSWLFELQLSQMENGSN